MRLCTSLMLVFMLPFGGTLAQSLDPVSGCVAVYQTSTASIYVQDKKSAESASLYDRMCSGKQVASDFSLDASAKFLVDAIPIDAGLGINSTEQRAEHFCSTYDSSMSRTESVSTYSRKVVTDGLNIFNGCMELATRSVTLQATLSYPRALTIKVGMSDPDGIRLETFATSENVTCTSPQVGGFNKILTNNEYRFDNGFSMSCVRDGTVDNGDTVYLEDFVAFTTSRSRYPFSFTLPAERLYSAAHAAVATENISRLESSVQELQNKLAESEANVGRLHNQIENVDSYPIAIFRGGANVFGLFWPGPGNQKHYQYVGCGGDTLKNMANRYCSTGYKYSDGTQLFSHSGGHCGYTLWVAACEKK